MDLPVDGLEEFQPFLVAVPGHALADDLAVEHVQRGEQCGRAAKHVTMHTLRHTASMNLLAAGVDVSIIALWLGHADTHSTDVHEPSRVSYTLGIL